jgi:propanol-preferring alcohol dehydrogenase
MSDIPSFPYEILWNERQIRSVANLTHRDGEEFLALASRLSIKTTVHSYRLEETNQALDDLRHGRFDGSAVITLCPAPPKQPGKAPCEDEEVRAR